MRFEWEDAKAAANLPKHGVSFDLARRVWDDPLHAVIPDRIVEGEQRWHAVGSVAGLTILVVVHTYRGSDDDEVIRIIAREKRPRTKDDAMSKTDLTSAERNELTKIGALSDQDIDVSDIPEAPPENWSRAMRRAIRVHRGALLDQASHEADIHLIDPSPRQR